MFEGVGKKATMSISVVGTRARDTLVSNATEGDLDTVACYIVDDWTRCLWANGCC